MQSLCAGEDTRIRDAVAKVVTTREQVRMRCAFRSCFGKAVNSDLILAPLKNPTDAVEAVLVILADMTEQAAVEQSLIQSERLLALGEIVAGVAHELNNPLTGILGYSQLLMTADVDVNIKGKLEHIAEEATRCRRIVQNLLSFARRREAEKSLQDINQILDQVVALREYQLRVDGIELTVELAPDLPLLLVDPHELQSVFLNIITNAQQALVTMEGRKRALRVGTRVEDTCIHIRFEDNGPGIPQDKLSKVFDPFFTTKGIGQGTGLGLSVSYGIVQSHGGRILLASTEGEGTTFTVVLPLNSNSV